MRGGAKFSFIETKVNMGQVIRGIQEEQALSSESLLWSAQCLI